MATQHRDDAPTKRKPAGREHPTAAIGKRVLLALGQPGDLYGVQVRPLWENHYRVNVLVGADAHSTRVAHSYFLVADGDGHIGATTPALTRHYSPPSGHRPDGGPDSLAPEQAAGP